MIRFLLSLILTATVLRHSGHAAELSSLKKEQRLGGFQVQNLYSDSDGKIMGAKFLHSSTGTPVFLLQLQTVPQVFTWVDTPINSNQGLPHALEHLLVAKGVQGHYFQLLHQMRLTPYGAATFSDFVAYDLSSEGSVDDFFESFHALLAAMYRPDFSDAEASKEFYHFGVSTGRGSKKTLIEEGTVYDEMRATQDRFRYYSELNKRIFGAESPFAFRAGGDPDQMRSVTPEDIRNFMTNTIGSGLQPDSSSSFRRKRMCLLFLGKFQMNFNNSLRVGRYPLPRLRIPSILFIPPTT